MPDLPDISEEIGDLAVSTYSDPFDHTPRTLIVWSGNPELDEQRMNLTLDELHALLNLIQRAHARIGHRHD